MMFLKDSMKEFQYCLFLCIKFLQKRKGAIKAP
jgi:hypothetical protein